MSTAAERQPADGPSSVRKVRAFLSGIDAEVGGLSIESFVFYPRGREVDGPSRAELVPPPVS